MSAILVPDVEPTPSLNATRLRDLDAFEEFFWLIEQSVTVFHAVVAEVIGATTIEQWKDASDFREGEDYTDEAFKRSDFVICDKARERGLLND